MESFPFFLSEELAELRISQRNSLVRTKLLKDNSLVIHPLQSIVHTTTHHLHRVNILDSPINPRCRLLESSQGVLQVDIGPPFDIPLATCSSLKDVCVWTAEWQVNIPLIAIEQPNTHVRSGETVLLIYTRVSKTKQTQMKSVHQGSST